MRSSVWKMRKLQLELKRSYIKPNISRLGESLLPRAIISTFVPAHFDEIKKEAENTTSHGKLLKIDPILIVGKYIYPDTGEMGIISKEDLAILLNGLDFVYRIEGKLDKKYDLF